MTKRQERYWSEQMRQLESDLIDFFRRHNRDQPDGSFAMLAFRKGYRAAQRDAQRAKEQGK